MLNIKTSTVFIDTSVKVKDGIISAGRTQDNCWQIKQQTATVYCISPTGNEYYFFVGFQAKFLKYKIQRTKKIHLFGIILIRCKLLTLNLS